MNPTREQVEEFICAIAPEYGLDPALVIRQVRTESNFDHSQIGKAGEIGLLQLMPATADELKVNPRDWKANLCGGMKYLSRQVKHFGDTAKGLAAYNCGPGRMASVIKEFGDDWRAHIPESTKDYLRKILEAV